MGKFKSWIQGSSSGSSRSTTAEEKKLNRRSFSGIAQLKSKREPETRSDAKDLEVESKSSTEMKPATLPDSQIISLAKIISSETQKLEHYYKSQGIPTPSFEADAPGDLPKLPADVQRSRMAVIFAADELSTLVRGPRESVRWGVWGVCYTAVPCIY